MYKNLGLLLMIMIFISSCASNQIQESDKEKLKDKLPSNYGIERIITYNYEGQLIDLASKEIKNTKESSCVIFWSEKISEKIVLKKKSEEVLIDKIEYNKEKIQCIQGVSISKIKEQLKIEDFEIIQNRYTCGLLAVGDIIKGKKLLVLAGNLKTNIKSGQNLVIIVFECGKNGKMNLLKKFYYYWPKEQQYNLALSYDMKSKRIKIDKAESEGSIEIMFCNGKFIDKFVE